MMESNIEIDIDFVFAGSQGGRIGMSACPGGPLFPRHTALPSLGDDLERIHAWGATGIITLNEWWELEVVRVTDMQNQANALGMRWLHLPIEDMQAPADNFEVVWPEVGAEIKQMLDRGERILVHCWAGLGRTGTIAARLLIEYGAEPEEAIRAVRSARAGAIQSKIQEDYVRAC